MKYIVLSDTHAPLPLRQAYEHMKTLDFSDVAAIVINGDLLGMFSMTGSNMYTAQGVLAKDRMEFLEQGAPNFLKKLESSPGLTSDLIIEYVQERYKWCYNRIKEFANMHRTIFNLGNHESQYHFLVLTELAFLIPQAQSIIQSLSLDIFLPIYDEFEKRLALLEASHEFIYIRNKPILDGDVLLFGIPGESHDTLGQNYEARMQEQKTVELIEMVKQLLPKAKHIVVFNHTQGNYDSSTSQFLPASPSFLEFMKQLPPHLQKRVWVQSHNHWSYTQFIEKDGFSFILNNAGLHGGIYNIVELGEHITVTDVDPVRNITRNVKPRDHTHLRNDHLYIISKHYDDNLDVFLHRRTQMED